MDLGDQGFQPLAALLPRLRLALAGQGEVSFSAPDPDLGLGLYAGEAVPGGRHRSWLVWAEVAEALGAHLLTPERLAGGRVQVRLRRSGAVARFGSDYGAGSEFGRIDKLEDPSTLLGLVQALRRTLPPPGGRILALGVGSGRELQALDWAAGGPHGCEVVGLDKDASALAQAQQRYPDYRFAVQDVQQLGPDWGRFDLILSLSLLQSPGVQIDPLLRTLRSQHLTARGSLVLGFPNVGYSGGELSYGARMRNFAQPDLSLLMADVAQVRRFLHKHGFKVFVTGKHEVFVTALPANSATPPVCLPGKPDTL
ncbi:class I SAM-dependent methyltransferase [Deinococcus lacus]|uniref:Class I SAM-dependent methyltransferase n=1 Tax=Deinococcus lacus TaxID=392561 RepID=A0ABW1YFK3_9DEIO